MLNDTRRAEAIGATPTIVTELVAPHDDARHYRYRGHTLDTRPIPQRQRTTPTARRTTTDDAPAADAERIVDTLRPGERATMVGRYRYTITRGKSGRYAIRAHTIDDDPTSVFVKSGVRSAFGTARRVLDVEEHDVLT